MIAYLPQRVFEITGVAIGLWMMTFGLIAIVRPATAAVRPGRPMRPRLARGMGATAVLVGLTLGIGSFFYDSEPSCGRCGRGPWGGTSTVVRLIAWLALLFTFAGVAWIRHRRR